MRYFNLIVVLCWIIAGSPIAADEFAVAVRIVAGNAPIDVRGFRGAAPYSGDFDGDGLKDLLVGQEDPGRLRIYRNKGTEAEPRFDRFEWFRVGGDVAEFPVAGLFQP